MSEVVTLSGERECVSADGLLSTFKAMLEMATLVERVGNIRLVDTRQLILRITDDPPLQNAGALHLC